MSDFKVGDRVRILPGVATPFVGMVGTISEVRPHERGIETMDQHVVVFERRGNGPSIAWNSCAFRSESSS